jgi:hypothetical protein
VATGPDLRVGDADREAAAARLREHYAQGRLTLEEFNQRLDAAFAATTQGQLNALARDLPRASTGPHPTPLPATPAGSGQAGSGWDRGRRQHRPRRGISLIFAALLLWLLIFNMHMMIPWPGKLAVFLLIFAAIRGVLRRLWRFGAGAGRMGCGPR